MPVNTTKIQAAKLISEYRENELKKKDPDLRRLQLLANTDRGPVATNTRRVFTILLILAVIAGVFWFKSCSTAHDAGKQNIVSLKIARSTDGTCNAATESVLRPINMIGHII